MKSLRFLWACFKIFLGLGGLLSVLLLPLYIFMNHGWMLMNNQGILGLIYVFYVIVYFKIIDITYHGDVNEINKI
jgi:hypothetical protein